MPILQISLTLDGAPPAIIYKIATSWLDYFCGLFEYEQESLAFQQELLSFFGFYGSTTTNISSQGGILR